MLLAAAEKLDLEFQTVDLFAGENYREPFTAINPNQAVPVLEDDDFRLAESSAILKYLAEKCRSATYPSNLRLRARVNERMDWFNTRLYRDVGYGLVYPQIIDSYRRGDDTVQAASLAWSREKAGQWLRILDAHIIGPENSFVCGAELTIADYLGASMITVGEVIHLDYSAYPNIMRWLRNMKALPYWAPTHEAFETYFVAPFRDQRFEGL